MIDIRDKNLIPPLMMRELEEYVEHGKPTCYFLEAVLGDRLMEACKRADENSLLGLVAIVNQLYNNVPMLCHGSPAIVEKWIDYHAKQRDGAAPGDLVALMAEINELKRHTS